VDSWLKKSEQKIPENTPEWDKVRKRRYLVSEAYIVGWLFLAVALVVLNQWLPLLFAPFAALRVIGIVNKELGVTLFYRCKITEGEKVSPAARVIILALTNYLTAGLLFAFLYAKLGTYQLDSTLISSPLTTNHALAQALSIMFALGPIYAPVDIYTRLLTISQSAFCFLYGVVIIASFVSLINLTPSHSSHVSQKTDRR